jgi:DNA repair protein RAD7
LTDFLAANNISAAQIRDDYERRQREAAAAEDPDETDEQTAMDDMIAAESAISRARRRRNQEETVLKIKKEKAKAKKGRAKKKSKRIIDSDDEDDDDEHDGEQDVEHGGGLAKATPKKKKKRTLPGQFENCEICEKRFTVTPYSKTGPDGGLVCTPCGKELDKDAKADKKPAPKRGHTAKRRRKVESERLDGVVRRGPKSLVQHCIETVVKYHDAIESLESMPEHLISRICTIFTKHRVMTSGTLPLFLRADLQEVEIFDCANLKTQDYCRIFAEVPRIKKLTVHNAYQFKDEAVDYMIEKAPFLEHLTMYAANLISSEKWSTLLRAMGFNLKTLKLAWLDDSFTDEQVVDLVRYCPNLQKLKLEYCWKLGPDSIDSLADFEKLEHLSLLYPTAIPNDNIMGLIDAIGPKLRTLSLRSFKDIDDGVLLRLHECCRSLQKLRLTDNDTASDDGWAALFQEWENKPLQFIDVSSSRDVDNQNPDGQSDHPIGLAGKGFAAMMAHSGESLHTLNMPSCRHVPLATLLDVFGAEKTYPKLSTVDMSFVHNMEDVVLAGLFKSARPGVLKRVALFGCFGISSDITVPSGVVVVGPPRIEQEGMEMFGPGGGGEDMQMPIHLMEQLDMEMAEADSTAGAGFGEGMEIEVAC